MTECAVGLGRVRERVKNNLQFSSIGEEMVAEKYGGVCVAGGGELVQPEHIGLMSLADKGRRG